jgi:hypothetical protein
MRRVSCAYIESVVVLAALGFSLGVGGGAIGQFIDGRYTVGVVLAAIALMPFAVWGAIRFVALRRAARAVQSK